MWGNKLYLLYSKKSLHNVMPNDGTYHVSCNGIIKMKELHTWLAEQDQWSGNSVSPTCQTAFMTRYHQAHPGSASQHAVIIAHSLSMESHHRWRKVHIQYTAEDCDSNLATNKKTVSCMVIPILKNKEDWTQTDWHSNNQNKSMKIKNCS